MRAHADRTNWLPPQHVLKPPAGTAILFGGDVTHAGLPVLEGTRHLFVMSFSLKPAWRPRIIYVHEEDEEDEKDEKDEKDEEHEDEEDEDEDEDIDDDDVKEEEDDKELRGQMDMGMGSISRYGMHYS